MTVFGVSCPLADFQLLHKFYSRLYSNVLLFLFSSRLTADIQDFKSSFKQCISQGVKSMTQAVGCIFMLYLVSPKLTSVMLILVPGVVLVGSFLGSLLRKLSRRAQEQVSKATTVAEETLSNMRTVRAFAMEDKEAR